MRPRHSSGSPPPAADPSREVAPPIERRRSGKVARLPKEQRDLVNHLLRDGVSYAEIIEKLESCSDPPLPHPISEQNLSRWKDGGHQDWLNEQAWLADTRARQESALELVGDFDSTQVNQAALQIASLHIFEALRDLGPGTLDRTLGGNSAAFARLLNALSRASRETLQLQKYRGACARARAELQPLRDPKRKLTEDERRAIVLQVDDILGLRSPDEEQPEPPPEPPPVQAPPEPTSPT